MSEEFQPKTVTLVYTRALTLEDGKPGVALCEMSSDKSIVLESEPIIFPRKSFSGTFIGGMYEVEQTGPVSFRLAARKYVGLYPDETKRAEWQLNDRAREIREEAARMEKKDKESLAALELLEPLRKVYRKALPNRKRAIEVLLLDYLRRP